MTTHGTAEAAAPPRPPRKRIGLAEQVLVGLALGTLAGVFFGEMASGLKIVGDVFIGLLQIT